MTGGLGFDLIVDMEGAFQSNKRPLLQLAGFYGRIVTTCQETQLDPSDGKTCCQKGIQMEFISSGTLLGSGLYDGVLMNLVGLVVQRVDEGSVQQLALI